MLFNLNNAHSEPRNEAELEKQRPSRKLLRLSKAIIICSPGNKPFSISVQIVHQLSGELVLLETNRVFRANLIANRTSWLSHPGWLTAHMVTGCG